jgi:hypothetical protein
VVYNRSARTNINLGYKERSSSYERALREKSHIIRETEMRNMNRKERSKPRTPVWCDQVPRSYQLPCRSAIVQGSVKRATETGGRP